MTTSLEAMQLYTKILTGMVLLLNVSLLLAIRMALKYARLASAKDNSEDAPRRWSGVRRGLAMLILTVVLMNGTAVFANYRLVSATREIATTLPLGNESDLLLSLTQQATDSK
jgi:hypothetical protein